MPYFLVPILTLDVPNKNNRVYSTETIDQAIAKAPSQVLGTFADDFKGTIDPHDVSHTAGNFFIDEGQLWCTVEVLKTPKGEVLKQIIESCGSAQVAYRSAGHGMIEPRPDGTVEVKDFTLDSVSVMLAKDAA